MTQQRESVVTPERFESGMTWRQYRDHIRRNGERFDANYEGTNLSDEDVAFFRSLVEREDGPAKVLALGEDWCPDVFRGLPVMVRIAEAAGMEMRIFPRDDNLDIMNEFLNKGEHQSIPVFVFYTRGHDYITHWIERPAKANVELPQMEALFEGKEQDEKRVIYREFQQGPIWDSWRDATVAELRELLERV